MCSLPFGIRCCPVEVAVVRREDHQRVGELAFRPQRLDDLLDALVHRQQRLELAAVLALDVSRSDRAQEGEVPDRGRLVGDVGLVEVRGLRQRLGVEGMGVARCRLRGVRPQLIGRVRIRARAADVRRRVGEPEEERLRLWRPAVDEVDRLAGQHVLLEVGRALGRSGPVSPFSFSV